jgi:hypothetical protein
VALAAVAASLLVACAVAQNPVPQVVGPPHPQAVVPGSGEFTLTVYGANFVPGAVVNWNYQPRTTTYISGHELQAQILSTDIAKNTAGYITVTNPAPGGGSSSASWAQVEVHAPISTVVVNPSVYYLFGFWQMQAADFNHDATLDLVGEYWGLGLDVGMGNGTFQPVSVVDRNNLSPFQFGYGDFNGDGNLDVASLSYLDSSGGFIPTHMSVMLGDGKGNFTRGPSLMSTWDDLGEVTVGDFNQDGKLDLVTKSTGGFLSTYLGNGDGSFRHVAHYLYPAQGLAWKMLAGDFDGDGKLDLILEEAPDIRVNGVNEAGIALWFLKGKGDGTFQKPREIASFPGAGVCVAYPQTLQLSDFNGDGKLDLALCTNTQIGVMLGNGDGSFQPPNFYTTDTTGQGLFAFAIGDLNSDGKPDLIVSEYSNFNDLFATLLGNGDGTFQAQQTIVSGASGAETGITVGDFNSDGLLDTVFLNGGGMYVFLQQ